MAAFLLVAPLGAASAAEHGKPAKAEGVVVDGPVFVKLPPIVLPVFKGDRLIRQAGLVVALELAKGKTEADIEPSRRKLYDAFITRLYTIYDQHEAASRVIDPEVVKEALQGTGDRVLGAGVIREVLIQQAFERTRSR